MVSAHLCSSAVGPHLLLNGPRPSALILQLIWRAICIEFPGQVSAGDL